MRLFCSILTLLFSTQILGAEFTRYLDKNKPLAIQILEKEKLHINENCFKHFKECESFLKKNANPHATADKNHNLIGHPAGEFCTNSNGKPEIFFDAKNNQYDFCNFNEQYIVDSWDFYNRYRK
jgi:hypothetical protein